jgi:hypothetical protein
MSIINLDSVKEAILAAVEKAIEECAVQHDANLELAQDPSHKELHDAYTAKHPFNIGNSEPVKLSLKLEFFWPNEPKCTLFCNPIVDLENAIK